MLFNEHKVPQPFSPRQWGLGNKSYTIEDHGSELFSSQSAAARQKNPVLTFHRPTQLHPRLWREAIKVGGQALPDNWHLSVGKKLKT